MPFGEKKKKKAIEIAVVSVVFYNRFYTAIPWNILGIEKKVKESEREVVASVVC